ncbi:hypothetical protein [Pseudomonas alkylphenolica]|uniref:hypothetical protein n=1 Tax=Pseudomonas alkylphenolica TaxID=237609 RepID=UPI000FEBBAB6|nr:hypothetical protein [Pseudomonas alkylphenolica]
MQRLFATQKLNHRSEKRHRYPNFLAVTAKKSFFIPRYPLCLTKQIIIAFIFDAIILCKKSLPSSPEIP